MSDPLLKATEIWLNRAEGPVSLCGERTFKGPDCWSRATEQLISWSHTAPKNGGYDKTDFRVTFEDGNTYTGRFDNTPSGGDYGGWSLAQQIRGFLRSIIQHPEIWPDTVDGETAAAFLGTYEIPEY